MCHAISGIAIKAGDTVDVRTSDDDSHDTIRKHHYIRDGLGAGSARQTPIELIPVRGVEQIDQFDFVFGAGQPDWWTERMTEAATEQLFRAWRARWCDKSLVAPYDLDLGSLTTLPAGVTLKAGGHLYLRSLTALPDDVKIVAKEVYGGTAWYSTDEYMRRMRAK